MELNLQHVEDACKELYIRALKLLPDDIKEGINDLKRKSAMLGRKWCWGRW